MARNDPGPGCARYPAFTTRRYGAEQTRAEADVHVRRSSAHIPDALRGSAVHERETWPARLAARNLVDEALVLAHRVERMRPGLMRKSLSPPLITGPAGSSAQCRKHPLKLLAKAQRGTRPDRPGTRKSHASNGLRQQASHFYLAVGWSLTSPAASCPSPAIRHECRAVIAGRRR